VKFMRTYETFCQVRVLTYCVMSNHFHILLEVPSAPEERGRDWSDEKLLDHLSCLYEPRDLAEIRWKLEHFRNQKNQRAAEDYRETFLCRMWNLSQFMKTLKQRFARWFNGMHGRCGTLWEERFRSVLVEDGHAARVMAAYIDLNPVRAGMVEDPQDYRWSSYGEAVAGNKRAREGIQRVMFESESAWNGEEQAAELLMDWRKALRLYREILYTALQSRTEEEAKGAPPLSEARMIGRRMRHFADGLVIGTSVFVNHAFRLTRERFGPKRKDGARKMRGVATALCSMRDLQVEVAIPEP
jgi:putative transposase